MSTLLTVKEAAAFLKLSPDTIYRATKAGTLPHVRIGRSIRLSREALEEYLSNSTVPVAPAPIAVRPVVTRL
jgi:excisionase family DNA binding protein